MSKKRITQQEIAPEIQNQNAVAFGSEFAQPVETKETTSANDEPTPTKASKSPLTSEKATKAENETDTPPPKATDELDDADSPQPNATEPQAKRKFSFPQITTLDITLIGVFTALGIILNMFSASFPKLPPFGRFSLIYGYCLLCGVILGGVRGGLCAAISDFIVAVILPEGGQIWMPLITISNFLMAFIPGLLYRLTNRKIVLTLILSSIISFLVCTLGFTALGETLLYKYFGSAGNYPTTVTPMVLAGTPVYIAFVFFKSTQQPLWIVLNLIVAISILKATEKRDVFRLKTRHRFNKRSQNSLKHKD